MAPPEGSAVGERLSLEGVAGGPFEPVSAAQMDKKKLLDKILPVSLLSVQPTQLRKGGVLFCAVSVPLRTFLLRGLERNRPYIPCRDRYLFGFFWPSGARPKKFGRFACSC